MLCADLYWRRIRVELAVVQTEPYPVTLTSLVGLSGWESYDYPSTLSGGCLDLLSPLSCRALYFHVVVRGGDSCMGGIPTSEASPQTVGIILQNLAYAGGVTFWRRHYQLMSRRNCGHLLTKGALTR